MAKKQIRTWYVRRVARFALNGAIPVHWKCGFERVAITHEGLKALEQAKKGAK